MFGAEKAKIMQNVTSWRCVAVNAITTQQLTELILTLCEQDLNQKTLEKTLGLKTVVLNKMTKCNFNNKDMNSPSKKH